MKIVKIKGGMGNQLFQYAFGKYLRCICDEPIKYDMSSYEYSLDDPIRKPRILKFNLDLNIASKEEVALLCMFKHNGKLNTTKYRIGIGLEATLNKKYYFEMDRAYRKPESISQYCYFDGYWQSWRIIDSLWEELRKELVPNYDISDSTKKMIERVSNERSVFMGVRRGDYLLRQKHNGVFGQEYYESAMEYIEKKVENPTYYIFSNDILWVKENIDFKGRNVVYREPEDIVDDFEDFLIMANCKHSIIINSTYHWWGARLNDNPGKIVVAPKKWFFDDKPIDIVPPKWIKI